MSGFNVSKSLPVVFCGVGLRLHHVILLQELNLEQHNEEMSSHARNSKHKSDAKSQAKVAHNRRLLKDSLLITASELAPLRM